MLRRTDMITACINVDCIRAEPRTTYPSMIFFLVFTPLNWIKRDRDTEITIDVCRSFNTGQNTKWNICYLNGCHPCMHGRKKVGTKQREENIYF